MGFVEVSNQSSRTVTIDIANRQMQDKLLPSLIGTIKRISKGHKGLFFEVAWDYGLSTGGSPLIVNEVVSVNVADDFDPSLNPYETEVTRLFQTP